MEENSSKRNMLLDKVNGATILLALLAVVAMIPGALRLFPFLRDAGDGIIEIENLMGWGDLRLPGGYAILEPYASLTIIIAAVAIPLILLITLLVKRARFSQDRTPGSGVYWFAVLVGAAVIFTALGFTALLINGNANIETSPLNLVFAAVGILMVISAVFAISLIGHIKTPDAEPQPIAKDSADGTAETVTLVEMPHDRPRIEQSVTIPVLAAVESTEDEDREEKHPDTLVQKDTKEPEEVVRTDIALSEGDSLPEGAVVAEELSETSPAEAVPEANFQGDPAPSGREAPDEREAPEGVALRESRFLRSDDLNAENIADGPDLNQVSTETEEKLTGLLETPPATVLKRRFLKFPDDDSKVIVLFRECAGDKVIKEWAEIRQRSEFTKR